MEQDNPFRAPLTILSVVLIASGAVLVLAFGYAAWQMLFHPETVEGVKYVFAQSSGAIDAPAFTLDQDGRVTKVDMNDNVRMFFRIIIGVMVFRALVGVGGALTGTGVAILRAISLPAAKRVTTPDLPL
ncbi:MAG TPA: hypothetical protein VEF76_12280 [Patescibacteria group bacterium]|nr:hypothetical protein [Patescibacteria group bacterium]